MFYPEINPAMKWHQLHNQRLYSNFVFPNCAKLQEEDPDFGEFLFVWMKLFLRTVYSVQSDLILLPWSVSS